MELRNKFALVIILSVCSVSCFPSRPLNDRPSELTWQAWLLVDSQNQLQNESDRRITPKSVFIAPKLGQRNDTLPDCADGYRADSMGRCIKFVKVDETAHLNFLLSRLNEMYAATSDEEIEESEEGLPTAGPLQVNIPLGQTEDSDENEDGKGVDVLPLTNDRFGEKLDVKRHPDTKPLEKPQVTHEDYDYEEQTDMVTEDFTEETTVETTTEYETTTEIPTTTEQTVDNDESQALFFKMPTKNDTKTITSQESTTPKVSEDIKTESQRVIEKILPLFQTEDLPNQKDQYVNKDTFVPKEEIPTYYKEQFYRPQLPTIQEEQSKEELPTYQKEITTHKLPLFQNDEPPFIHKQELPNINTELPFVRDEQDGVRAPTMRFPEHQQEHIIRFPVEEYPANVKPHYGPVHNRPQELTQEQIQELFRQYLNRQYPERPQPERTQLPPERIYNHRNRDRNEDFWGHSSTIKEEKPLVTRFQRYPSPYFQQKQAPHHEVQFFEQDTGQDYSNTYGRKRRRGNLR